MDMYAIRKGLRIVLTQTVAQIGSMAHKIILLLTLREEQRLSSVIQRDVKRSSILKVIALMTD